jgi:pimeloyl-ACP methyl ester carboxylesterase
MDTPETHYVKSGTVHIAYQVVGESAIDLVVVPGIFTNVDYQWEEPSSAAFLRRLASFARLILFDPRGTGLSDRAPELPTVDQQMDDVNAVVEAVGSKRAAIFGLSQGGPMAALYAATYPGRTSALVLYATYPCVRGDADYPWGRSEEWLEEWSRGLEYEWGKGTVLSRLAPSAAGDEYFRRWWMRLERYSSAPGNALAYYRMNVQIDIRQILPTIKVPTLVLHRAGDTFRPPGTSRYIAARIPGARYVEVPGVDHLPYVGDADAIADEIQEFITGVRPAPEPDRILATVVFTDIVGSSHQAAALGDHRWRALLEHHRVLVRKELQRFRGREVDTAGDGFLATFDGPARAIRCSMAIQAAVDPIGLAVRAGVHTGEIELMDGGVGGIAVHIAARVAALAGAGQVLVSSTVKDLVAGSGIRFEEVGTHDLKGIPGEWRLYSAREAPRSAEGETTLG